MQTKSSSDKQCFCHIILVYAKAISTFLEKKKSTGLFLVSLSDFLLACLCLNPHSLTESRTESGNILQITD